MLRLSFELTETASLFHCSCYGYCGFLPCFLEGLLAFCLELPLVGMKPTPRLHKLLCTHTLPVLKIAGQASISRPDVIRVLSESPRTCGSWFLAFF